MLTEFSLIIVILETNRDLIIHQQNLCLQGSQDRRTSSARRTTRSVSQQRETAKEPQQPIEIVQKPPQILQEIPLPVAEPRIAQTGQ